MLVCETQNIKTDILGVFDVFDNLLFFDSTTDNVGYIYNLITKSLLKITPNITSTQKFFNGFLYQNPDYRNFYFVIGYRK
jgi:hypothetical protein